MDPAWREQRGGEKKVGGWLGNLNPIYRQETVGLGESATAYTFQIENFSRKNRFPSRNPRHFLTVKVLECGAEERGAEVAHRGKRGGSRGNEGAKSVKRLKFGPLLRAHPP